MHVYHVIGSVSYKQPKFKVKNKYGHLLLAEVSRWNIILNLK